MHRSVFGWGRRITLGKCDINIFQEGNALLYKVATGDNQFDTNIGRKAEDPLVPGNNESRSLNDSSVSPGFDIDTL